MSHDHSALFGKQPRASMPKIFYPGHPVMNSLAIASK
jgi:hypothetical protein